MSHAETVSATSSRMKGSQWCREHRRVLIGSAVAIVVLCVWALPRLGDRSLWLDEAYTQAAIEHLGQTVRDTRGTMSLYYLFLDAWAMVSTSPTWLRAASLSAALATIPFVAAIARRLFGPRVAAIAPLVVVASPMFRWQAVNARSYALEGLFVVASWWVLLHILDQRGSGRGRETSLRRLLVGFALLSTLGPLIHGLYGIQLVPMVIVAAWGDRPLRRLRPLYPAVIGCGVTTVALVGWSGNEVPGAVSPGGFFEQFADMVQWYLSGHWWGSMVIGVLAVCGVVALSRHGTSSNALPSPGLLVSCWLIVPLVLLGLVWVEAGIFMPRYANAGVPAFALLVALGVDALYELLRRSSEQARGRRGALRGAVVIALALAVVLSLSTTPGMREDWRGAAALVARDARPGDGIIWVTEYGQIQVLSRVPFEAAWNRLDPRFTPVAVSPDRPIGTLHRIDEPVPLAVLRQRIAHFDRIWLVDYEGQGAVVGLARQSPLSTEFSKRLSEQFEGGIEVMRFDRF